MKRGHTTNLGIDSRIEGYSILYDDEERRSLYGFVEMDE